MTNTPLTVIDGNGTSITVLSDDYGLGFGNAAGTSTQLVGIDSSDTVTFASAISALPAGDFLFVTSAIKQDRFEIGQSIAINKDLFRKCFANTSGSTIAFKRIYGSLKVVEDKANIDTQLVDSSGGSGTFVTLSGDVVSQVTGGATTIQTGVVTNAKLATVPTLTIKGKDTAGTGAPKDLTVTEVKTMLAINNVDNTSDANKPVSTAQAVADALKIDKSLLTTKGDVIAATAANTPARVGVGSDGQVLTADAASAAGVKWATPSGGGGSSLTVTTVGTAIFQYEILTGTPVIGYTKTGGAGNGVMTCTGGTIKLRQFTDDIVAADLAASPGSIRFDLVGTGTVAKLARSFTPTKYTLNATDALADASTSGTTSNQADIDNTPPVKYGNIVLTSHGAMSIRLDNVTPDLGIDIKW